MLIAFSEFLTTLDKRDLDDKRFVLLNDLVYASFFLQTVIKIGKGFVSDGASVPRLPIAYWLYGDRAHHESVLHDWGYQTHLWSKYICDKLFLEAMIARAKPWYIHIPMYWAVKLGGRKSYRSGPKRIEMLNPNIVRS